MSVDITDVIATGGEQSLTVEVEVANVNNVSANITYDLTVQSTDNSIYETINDEFASLGEYETRVIEYTFNFPDIQEDKAVEACATQQ